MAKKIGIICALIVCVVAGIAGFQIKKQNDLRKATEEFVYTGESRFDWIYAAYEGANQTLVVVSENNLKSPADHWLGGRYLSGGKLEYTKIYVYDEFVDKELHTGEIYIFDVFERRIVKTIDYKPIIEQYAPGFYYKKNQSININDEHFLIITVSNYKEDEELITKNIWINIDTDEIQVLAEDEVLVETAERNEAWHEEFYGEENSIWDLLRANDYDTTDMVLNGYLKTGECSVTNVKIDGTFVISVALSSLSADNEVLNENFPELKYYDSGKDYMITFYFSGYPSKEEVISLLE